MTVSTHVYEATLLPDTPLPIVGGEISLDATRAPHVEATVTVAVSDASLLAALDPRTSQRVRIDVAATFPTFSQSRTFDLSLRGTHPNRAEGTVDLTLASDETVAEDYAPLADDTTPRQHQASLRAVVGYVLGKIGASLEPGDEDADVTAYWAATNRAVNGGVRVDAAGWAPGSGTSAVTRVTSPTIDGLPSMRYTASGTGNAFLNTPVSGARVTPGEEITVSVRMASASTSRPARVMLRFWNASGGVILDSYSTAVMTSTNSASPTTVSRTRIVPPGAVSVSAFVNTQTNTAGQNHYVSALMFGEDLPFFDGASILPGYTVDWEDAANGSTSTRTPIIERPLESLTWRAGVGGISFLSPLVQAAGFRLVCDEARRWTLREDGYRAPGALTLRHGVNIVKIDEETTRDEDTWCDAAVYVYTWTDKDGIEQTRIDAWSLTPTPTKVIRREIDAPFPGPGRAQYAVRRAQGRGRALEVTAVANWAAHAEQAIAITPEGAPIQTGITDRITYDLDNDEYTVSTRTTDTPAGAIDLLPGTINALAGTISSL